MKLTDQDIEEIKREVYERQREKKRKRRLGKRLFDAKHRSDRINTSRAIDPIISKMYNTGSLRHPSPPDTEYKPWANPVGSKWGVDKFHPLRISARYVLWFHANEYYWQDELEERKSQIYHSRHMAEWAFSTNQIIWLS